MRRFYNFAMVLGLCCVLSLGAGITAAFGAESRSSDALSQSARKKACKFEKKDVKEAKADLNDAEDGSAKQYKTATKELNNAKEDLSDCTAANDKTNQVRREPINKSTADPFAPPGAVGQDEQIAPVQVDAPTTVDATKVGLYGGTMDYKQCDKEQLKNFLTENPDKGTAWAEVLGVTLAELPSYIDKLTPVLLRSDTRVTNHSFKNGKATPLQSVLQAGTAVLLDEYGQIVTKCYCGNPLKPPDYTPPYYPPTNGTTTTTYYNGTTTTTYYDEPPYYGPQWPEWTPINVTVIRVTVEVKVTVFVLTDVKTGQTFNRPAGTDGTSDTPTSSAPTKQPSTKRAPTTPTTYPNTTTTDPYCYEDPPGSGNIVCA